MRLIRKGVNVDARAILPIVVIAAGLAAGALLLPADRRLVMEMLLVFAMAQGWNLLCGYIGLLSFGHHAFVGLGAYALFLTVNMLGVSPCLSLAASALVCILVALVMALLLHRLRDAYFSIGIWVLADSLRLVFGQWEWAGSSRGVVLDASAIDPAGFADTVFWLALALALATQIGIFALLRSRMGLALMAIRDNEHGAASIGIAVARNRLAAFDLRRHLWGRGRTLLSLGAVCGSFRGL
jgi:branched-chain amino acid transport system permease protein